MTNSTISTAPLVARDATAASLTKRQFVRFAFYKVLPEWRLKSVQQKDQDRKEVRDLINQTTSKPNLVLRTYSLIGTRGDCDFMIWLVADDLEDFQTFSQQLNQTNMAGYLESPYHYFAMTKRSTYVDKHEHEGQEGKSNRLVIVPGKSKYLFVYPFVKTRAWYQLPAAERQRQMTAHIEMGHKYPSVKINTTYSFGLDDQEFVVAFESNSVADFLDLVHEMRESEASTHTVRDVPSFTCIATNVDEMLAAIG